MANSSQPVPKKRKYQNIELKPFPLDCKLIGYFTGLDVEVFESDSIEILTNCGSYGENSRPRHMLAVTEKTKLPRMSKDDYDRKIKWREKFGENSGKVILANDGEQEDPYVIPNSQVLCPEEAMFLHKEINCLEIRNTDDQLMSVHDLWREFCELNDNFPASYAAYVYLKSKNWVIKSGSKFGGQYLLYKQSPKYYHASYIVKLVINTQRSTKEHQTNERIAESTKKSMIYLEIDFPTDLNLALAYETLDKFTVKEIAFHRHIVKKLTL